MSVASLQVEARDLISSQQSSVHTARMTTVQPVIGGGNGLKPHDSVLMAFLKI